MKADDNMKDLVQALKEEILKSIDLSKELTDDELIIIINSIIAKKSKVEYLSIRQREYIRQKIFNSLRRLDILQELIDDKSISEIMINGIKHIFIEQRGKIKKWEYCFESEQKLLDIIQQIASDANRMVNEMNPILDARLRDGSRVNVVLPPVSLDGPVVTIRKFPEKAIDMERLIEIGSITEEAASFLKLLVISGYNIFVSGGTGSGKTTLLNALSNYIPDTERIITIEDSAELQINGIPNLIRLEVRNANVEGKNEISIRDLIKSSLRMRPDRIIIGEVRDAAAVDMLQGLNTGHSGLCTGHANSPEDMLSRLETMVLLGALIPLMAVRRQIASAIDIIIQLSRFRDCSRRIQKIVEVTGVEAGEIKTSLLYDFIETGEDAQGMIIGSLERTDNYLTKVEKLKHTGLYNLYSNKKGEEED